MAGAGGDGGTQEPPPSLPQCAGALDATTATRFYDAARCLFEGEDPPQVGVEPDVIDAERVAILRGRVLDSEGEPLSDVLVRVAKHDEFGETWTRQDGYFDAAVNGGGLITVRYEKDGYLPVQRRLPTEWRNFAVFPDVVLIEQSVDSGEIVLQPDAPSVFEGPYSSDESGDRHELLFAGAGTQAALLFEDGSREPLDSLNISITEYTVGAFGPARMPGELPPSSAYTYAVEYSVEEAQQSGAVQVEFDPPLVSYVENFLDFPAGTLVPHGYYDVEADTWRANESGIVLTIVGIESGRAEIDSDGDGVADDPETLAALGVDADELSVLAERYEVDQSLWRVRVPHFSAWDCNWPFGPPDGAAAPDSETDAGEPPGCQSLVPGSIIGCEGQTLGEVAALSGTAFNLHYQSERMSGRRDPWQAHIRLAGETLPEGVKRIVLRLDILGQKIERSYDPEPNLFDSFIWDGKDAYGRTWQGRQRLTVRVGYVYDGAYQRTSRFGFSGDGVPITGDRSREEVTLWTEHRELLGAFEPSALGLGGWTLDQQHVYDASSRTLYLGHGQTQSAESIPGVITTIAGTGEAGISGDEGPASQAELNMPHGLVVAPDGTVFIADEGSHRIRKMAPDGTITTYAGSTNGFAGDGGPAVEALLNRPMGLALAPDGTLYVADRGNGRVRAISPDGIIDTVAGAGPGNTTEDDVPALEVLMYPHALALGHDGSLYISDDSRYKVLRLGTDGRVTRYAGNSTTGATGDGGPATLAGIGDPLGLVANSRGELFVTDHRNHRVRKIDANGIITTVAGGGTVRPQDGLLATEVALGSPHTVDLSPEGSLYITNEGSRQVLRVSPQGIIHVVAGGGTSLDDNGPPLQARFGTARIVFVHKDGTLWVADFADHRIRRIRPALPGFSRGEVVIAASDAQKAFVFDEYGRHQRTLDTLTRATLWSFEYQDTGVLENVLDSFGNATALVRENDGSGLSVIGPYNETNSLEFDNEGYLASLTNANAETTEFGYRAGGLLTSISGPRSRSEVKRFEYDELGRLIRDEHPSDRALTLERTDKPDGTYSVVLSTRLGRTQTFTVADRDGQHLERTRTLADGREFSLTTDQSQITRRTPLGITVQQLAGDPRFGMQSAFVGTERYSLNQLPIRTTTRTRAATLSDPSDPLSLESLEETITVNGAIWRSNWDATTRTLTWTSPVGRQARVTYNPLGQIVSEQLGDLTALAYAYDRRGRMETVTQGSWAFNYSYGTDGRVAWIEDALGQTTSFSRDPVGRPLTIEYPDGEAVSARYDARDNLLGLSPPGRSEHAFSYDPDDLVMSYTPPAVTRAADTRTSYAYDQDGALTTLTLPGGEKVEREYDPTTGRLLRESGPDGVTEYTYDALGLVTRIAVAGQTLDYGYTRGLWNDQSWLGAVRGRIGRSYDANDRVTREAMTSGSIDYAYDADGLLIQAGAATLTRDPATGLVTQLVLGGAVTDYTYDGRGQLAGSRTTIGNQLVYSFDLVRDALGRLTQRSETAQGVQRTDSYAYDEQGRLAEVRRNNALVASYGYDPNGNRLLTRIGTSTLAAIYDAQDRLTSFGSASYAYRPDGALTTKTEPGGTTSYDYAYLGGLRGVVLPDATAIDYTLDGQRRRIAKRRNGTLVNNFVYRDDLSIVAEVNPQSAINTRYVYGTLPHSPDYLNRGGRTYRLISDERGSIRLVADVATGEVVQALDYDAWGAVTEDTSPGWQLFGFAGGVYDADTGLVRFGARDYDPHVGRWTQKDPILFNMGEWNLHVYVGGDPINRVDPLGLWGLYAGVGGGAGFCWGLCVGSWSGGAGVYVGSDGIGVYGSGQGGLGLGAHAGAGLQVGGYTGPFGGWGVGAEGVVGLGTISGASVTTGPGGTTGGISVGWGGGLYGGAVASRTWPRGVSWDDLKKWWNGGCSP